MCSVSRRNLFEIWLKESTKDAKRAKMFSYVLEHFDIEAVDEKSEVAVMGKIANFSHKVSQRWEKSHRMRERFLTNYSLWLEENIVFPELQTFLPTTESQPSTSGASGRPRIPFEEGSEKTKRRRVQTLLSATTGEEIMYAAQTTLHLQGQRDAAALLKEMVSTSPKRATHIKKSFHSPPSTVRKITKEEALATFLDGKMSKRSYVAVQQRLKSIGSKVFPSYPFITEARKECYPDDILITEVSAEVKLQSLIDHTTKRLCEVQQSVLTQYKNNLNIIELIFKWGCDGTSGFSQYKQTFTEEHIEGEKDIQIDSAMFVISLVPLQLHNLNKENDKEILWHNRTPSSTRWCRPIKLLLKSESAELIKVETENVERQVAQLSAVKIIVDETVFFVRPKLLLTMVDGKICNSIMEVSSQKCYVCGCTPKDMNNPSKLLSNIDNPESYQFGLSSLHAKIRCFECLLKIAYRLDTKKWQLRGGEDKEKAEKRKKEIQKKFRMQMGLLVDVVKQGYGTSNDGNTARRFFENSSLSSSITGIDEKLIKQFSVLLEAISCGYEINAEAFKAYASETLDRYLQLYSWYFMPVTVHKLLVHGYSIVKHALLPIGQLSEEAQESRHKEIKKYREGNSRKFSRKATMEDVIHMLFVSSDPVINSHRRKIRKPLRHIPAEVLSLLASPRVPTCTYDTDSDDDDEDEDGHYNDT